MEENFLTGNMFSYQQIVDGMKFSIDQLDEQIKSIDKRMENTWIDLKEICENFSGEKFDGTLEAVDHFFASNVLESSVCCDVGDSVGSACCKLNNFLKLNPGSESQVFNCLLRIQFKEGLNFPICFKNNDALECDSRKSLFDGNESFNELCTVLQKHFLDQLLMDEMNEIHFKKCLTLLENKRAPLGNNYHNFSSFAKEKIMENKAKCFQRLSLLSTSNHSLTLYRTSKSLKVKSKIEQITTNISDFMQTGNIIMDMMDEDVMFLRLCIAEDDIINFISTIYLDPLFSAINVFVENLTSNGKNKSDSSKKCSSKVNIKHKSESHQSLKDDTIDELLQLIGWLLKVEDMLIRLQESSLRCMVGQERLKIGRNENRAELKSALKNSGMDKKKQSNQPSLTDVFNWRPIFDKFSTTFLNSFDNKIKESNKNDFSSAPVPASLQANLPMFLVASKNSIEILEIVARFSSFVKFANTSDKSVSEKFLNLLYEIFSENVETISKKIDKEITIETLVIIASGISLSEAHMKHFLDDLRVSDSNIVDLLQTAKHDLVQLIRMRFMDVINTSIWYEESSNSGDGADNDIEENEPEYWLQNWWLQVEWLWSILSTNCTFEVSRQILMSCVSECMQTFAWHFASKRLGEKQVCKFVSNVQALLSRCLDSFFRCCRRTEELIDACSNDGNIHEVHVSCVALTTTLLVSASPLPVLKEMYEQYSNRPKHGLQVNAIVGRECQWLNIVKEDWNLSDKTSLDQLDVSTSYEIVFGMLEHYPFEKQHLLLQLMFIHDSHFTITILRHLLSQEEASFNDDNGKKDADGLDDVRDDDDDDGIALTIHSLLSIIYNYGPDEEPVFEKVLEKIMKEPQGVSIFKEKSMLFKFVCSTIEPVILSIVWKSLNEIDETSPAMSSLMSDISYFSKERLFCGCKPSDSEEISADDEHTRQVKIFITELFTNLHHLPFSIVRICFKYDKLQKDDNHRPFIIKILLATLKKVLNKSKTLNLFNESQINMMDLISIKLQDLMSSSSSSSSASSSVENFKWFKEEFLDKMNDLSREILKDRRDENDPGLSLPRSHHSSLVFEVLLQSIMADESDGLSMDVITQFFIDNSHKMKSLFKIDGSSDDDGDKINVENDSKTLMFDVSSLKNACVEPTKRNDGVVYSPLKSLEVFKHGGQNSTFTNWNLCTKLDLGLTEVNFPNLLLNRPEFRDGGMSNLDDSMKEFLNTLIQKHMRNPS